MRDFKDSPTSPGLLRPLAHTGGAALPEAGLASASGWAGIPRFAYTTGFEGTQIYGHGTDVLETTEHTVRFRDDFDLLLKDGISTFRCCIPWHKAERVRGRYDWSWTDEYLAHVRSLGLLPIVDPLHHTSFPEWLEDGFANPEFPYLYRDFVRAFAQRYPWVTHYTIINEPLATAVLSGLIGAWYPYGRDNAGFVPIVLGKAKAICLIAPMLESMVEGLRIVHVDTCERHHALDPLSQGGADFRNSMRFVVLDLILGRVTEDHPLWPVLSDHGLSPAEAEWFQSNPARIDVLGLDYYPHSELGWTRDGQSQDFTAWGFKRTALEYVDRYGLPIKMSETNVRGRIEDRLSWLKYMVAEAESLAPELELRGSSLREFCWYPYIDSTDWDSLVREPNRSIDPQGIYYLTDDFERQGSELSETYAALARGEIGSAEIPAYRFEEPVLDGRGVRKFLPHMSGWDWRD